MCVLIIFTNKYIKTHEGLKVQREKRLNRNNLPTIEFMCATNLDTNALVRLRQFYNDRLADLLAQHMTNVYVLDFLDFSIPFGLPSSFAQSKQTRMKCNTH